MKVIVLKRYINMRINTGSTTLFQTRHHFQNRFHAFRLKLLPKELVSTQTYLLTQAPILKLVLVTPRLHLCTRLLASEHQYCINDRLILGEHNI
jgi:hypothetical protein